MSQMVGMGGMVATPELEGWEPEGWEQGLEPEGPPAQWPANSGRLRLAIISCCCHDSPTQNPCKSYAPFLLLNKASNKKTTLTNNLQANLKVCSFS